MSPEPLDGSVIVYDADKKVYEPSDQTAGGAAFDTQWRNVAAAFHTAAGVSVYAYELVLRREAKMVFLQGYLWGGSTSTAPNFLPVGFRPRLVTGDGDRLDIAVFGANGLERVSFTPNGALTLPGGGGGPGTKFEIHWHTDDPQPDTLPGTEL
jgi:hypothetical protein